MCGIAGYWSTSFKADPDLGLKMAEQISHRGPDAHGVWHDEPAGVVLAHRRLSVLELSEAGAQPMTSESGRYIIVFNGEIYNHLDLRASLQLAGNAPTWRGNSDTETLLAMVEAYGMADMLPRLRGMFAFGLWDRRTNCLSLARDALGEKPLYYGVQDGTLLFGSELAALAVHPACKRRINRNALHLYLRFNYIPQPHSIWEGIFKLPPGGYLTLSAPNKVTADGVSIYWDITQDAITKGREEPFEGDFQAAADALETKMESAIERQMLSDVPLGAFLSGGIDSSTVVALLQKLSSQPVKTFSIGTDSSDYNEAHHAKAVAAHLGTDHHELYVSAEDALSCIPKLAQLYSEPFADSSQIPTHLVSQLARQEVTVALSGDGGDELFAGYNRYIQAENFLKTTRVPRLMREAGAGAIRSLSPSTWSKAIGLLGSVAPEGLRAGNVGDRLHKAAGILAARDGADYYRKLTSITQSPASLLLEGTEPSTAIDSYPLSTDNVDAFVEDMMRLDTMTYLSDDILHKVDRAAMGVSLEVRVPFLDIDLVRYAWSLPMKYKLAGGVGKLVLREVLYRQVPKSLIERPKMGFGLPLDVWLRGPLRDWAEDLLSSDRLALDGIFTPPAVRKIWQEHLSGRANHQYQIWSILVLNSWLDGQVGGSR